MMTGNSMWMAAALVESRFRDVAFYLTVIASYIGGVSTFRRVEFEWKENALNAILAPIVMGFLIGSDLLTLRDASCRWIPAVMLAYAWGIINSGKAWYSRDCLSYIALIFILIFQLPLISVGSEVTGTLIFVVTGAMVRWLSNR